MSQARKTIASDHKGCDVHTPAGPFLTSLSRRECRNAETAFRHQATNELGELELGAFFGRPAAIEGGRGRVPVGIRDLLLAPGRCPPRETGNIFGTPPSFGNLTNPEQVVLGRLEIRRRTEASKSRPAVYDARSAGADELPMPAVDMVGRVVVA